MPNVCRQILKRNFVNFRGIFGARSFSSECCDDSPQQHNYDLVVVGGGIVGVASAREIIKKFRQFRIAIVEKEHELAHHQSGHNSGVIHAGIYYTPGSLKAKLCVEGLKLTYAYLEEKDLPYKKVGKLIVATDESEVGRLNDLHERGKKNGVPDLVLIDGKDIPKYEPSCRGVKALYSPHTGIVDFKLVTESYGEDFQECGGCIYLNFEVTAFQEGDGAYPVVIVAKNGQKINTKYVLTCGGLYSDKLAELSGCSRDPRIVPFRGEYLLLSPKKAHLIKGNIYPVPDPRFPFLGVHFTPRMDGSIWLGPNAVLALKREGYSWSDINPSELIDALSYAGFRKMASKYMTFGCKEMIKSFFIRLRVGDLKKYVPELEAKDITKGPAGVRAQALANNGELVDDFYFDMGRSTELGRRILHCRNAPSPGGTSSLAIAKMMADKVKEEFKWK